MKLVAVGLFALALPAYGQTVGVAGDHSVGAGAVSGSNSDSTSNSAARATGGNQSQTAGANAQQGQTANNSNTVAPNQNVNINGSVIPDKVTQDINYSGTTTQRYAPGIVAPVLNPTVPCVSVYSAGVSVVGVGATLGASVEDKECTRREFARMLQIIGQADAAMSLLCGNDSVAKAAPNMCKRVQVALGVDAKDILPVVASASGANIVERAPPAIIPPTSTVPNVSGPKDGQLEKGNDGKTYRFNGQSWVPVTDAEIVVKPLQTVEAPVGVNSMASNNVYVPQQVKYTK